MVSKTFVRALYLAQCAAWVVLTSVLNKYTIFQIEEVSDMSYEVWYFVDIAVYPIPA